MNVFTKWWNEYMLGKDIYSVSNITAAFEAYSYALLDPRFLLTEFVHFDPHSKQAEADWKSLVARAQVWLKENEPTP